MKKLFALLFILSINVSCNKKLFNNMESCKDQHFNYNDQIGCDDRVYPDPATSKYILPYLPNEVYKTGLTNCSSSYHGPTHADRYAFDFDMPLGSKFYASRGGVIKKVVNTHPSNGGGAGNYCVIDHLDGTYGLYYHSPKAGISVAFGEEVKQGELLGITGKSGLAGYPHLHFIVVQNGYKYPYDAIPISFSNVNPKHVILKSNTTYKACEY